MTEKDQLLDDFWKAEVVHVSAVQLDEIRAAAYRAGRLAQAEEDAALIKANTIQHSSGGDCLKPRYDGDRAGLAYADAILANAASIGEGGE